MTVLNLIINGLPSIPIENDAKEVFDKVLNLIINGLPSILCMKRTLLYLTACCFKPYYKWITFNT